MKPSSRKKWPYPYEEQLLATGNRLCQNRLFKTHNHQNTPSKNKSLKSGHFGSWAWNAHTYFTWLLLCCGHAFLTYQPSQSISFRGELTHSQAQGEERACQNLRGGLATVPQDSSESSLLPCTGEWWTRKLWQVRRWFGGHLAQDLLDQSQASLWDKKYVSCTGLGTRHRKHFII